MANLSAYQTKQLIIKSYYLINFVLRIMLTIVSTFMGYIIDTRIFVQYAK